MTEPMGPTAPKIPITIDRGPRPPSRPSPTQADYAPPLSRSLLIGWIVILAVIAPVVAGGLIGGERGASVVLVGYLGLTLVFMLSMMAVAIGGIVRPGR